MLYPQSLKFSSRPCPKCAGVLVRVPRRLIDRVTSIFSPVKRYYCPLFSCQWKGNLSSEQNSAFTNVSTGAPSPRRRARSVSE